MQKLTKGLLVTVTILSLGWSAMTALYTHTVSEELGLLRQESHSDNIHVRCRLRELESVLTMALASQTLSPAEPVDGVPTESDAEDAPAETTTADETATEPVTEPASDTLPLPDTVEPETEMVTLPTLEALDVRPGAEDDAPEVVYLIGVHEGRVALFDAAGEVLETVNVFVMTLPAADRAALEVGISQSSLAEARAVLARYE